MSTVPVLLLISFGAFFLLHLIPGDPVVTMLGERADPRTVSRLRDDLGLNKPLPVQYGEWLLRAVQGNLGRSIRSPQPVTEAIWQRVPATVQLAVEAMVVALGLALPLGVAAAMHRGSLVDRLSIAVAALGVALPSFCLGIILILVFSLQWRWLPPSGYTNPTSDLGQSLRLMLLPALTLAVALAAELLRITRASMLDVLDRDYVRTARGKGLPERAVVWRHALQNALIPLTTIIGLQLGRLFGGAVIVETIFAIPGLGRLLVDSIGARDFPVVQGVVLFMALMAVLTSLIVDVGYAVVDPRVRYA